MVTNRSPCWCTTRIEALAKDIIQHFETRQQAMKGKGMIVTMSRRIAVDLYDEIIRQNRNGIQMMMIKASSK